MVYLTGSTPWLSIGVAVFLVDNDDEGSLVHKGAIIIVAVVSSSIAVDK